MADSDPPGDSADDSGKDVLGRRRDYEVGYGKPPREHQFQPGRSGNPKGRPKGAKGLRTELGEEISERVVITIDGRPRKVSKLRVILKALAAKAAKGNVAAADKLLRLAIQAFGLEDECPATRRLSETDELILSRFLGEAAPLQPTLVESRNE